MTDPVDGQWQVLQYPSLLFCEINHTEAVLVRQELNPIRSLRASYLHVILLNYWDYVSITGIWFKHFRRRSFKFTVQVSALETGSNSNEKCRTRVSPKNWNENHVLCRPKGQNCFGARPLTTFSLFCFVFFPDENSFAQQEMCECN